jgi:hypothetical protein
MVARRTQTNQAINRSKLVHHWLNLGSQRAKFVNDDDSNHAEQYRYCQADEYFCHLLTCSHPGALKTCYDASETLWKAIKSHVAGPSLMKAIRCWTKDPSQPPTVKVGILCTQNDVNRAIATQTETGWLHIFRGFVSIDWGHVNFEEETITNPSEECSTYLNRVRHALKSRSSPDARRASANAYLKTVIQALQDYTLTIWAGRNAALHAKTQDTILIVHAQLNGDSRRLRKLKDSFTDSAKQYFNLPKENTLSRHSRNRQRWLQLARLVVARASDRGTGQQIISTLYPCKPSSFRARSTTTNAGYVSYPPTTSIKIVLSSQTSSIDP